MIGGYMSLTDWEKFFEIHAPGYMENVFTRNTKAEVDFIINEMKLNPGEHILDMGCGTGRHSVELARRGFEVTGVDLSQAMLNQASKAAESAGVEVEFIRSNAAEFQSDEKFDAAISLCEGAFSLFGKDEDPYERDAAILDNVHRSLKPGRYFLLTVLNAMRHIRMYDKEAVRKGVFNPYLYIERTEQEVEVNGVTEKVTLLEKGYASGEIILMMRAAHFRIINMWGGTAGAWNKDLLDPDEYEIMFLAAKN